MKGDKSRHGVKSEGATRRARRSPRDAPATRAARARPASARESRRSPVAIVDDQRLVREALARLVDGLSGFRVVTAAAEIEALSATPRGRAAKIAVVDIELNGCDVFAWVDTLVAIRPTLRILLLDNMPSTAHLRRARRCGAAGYASKCDSADDLATALAQVAAGHSAFPGHIAEPGHGHAEPGHGHAEPGHGHAEPGHGHAHRMAVTRTLATEPTPALLSPRETQVLVGLAEGLSVKRCAVALEISPNTVDNHKTRIMRKLGMHKTVELTRFAIRHGLVADG